jgi:hypothetical protein
MSQKKQFPDRKPAENKENDTKKHPMTKEDVANSKDEKIDQDFPGFPHPPASEKIIKHKKTNS